MPPKRSRLVVDEHQPTATAAAPTSSVPTTASLPASLGVQGFPAVREAVLEEPKTHDAPPRRPVLPASVLARMPEASRRLYEVKASPAMASSTVQEEDKKRERETGPPPSRQAQPPHGQEEPASPTGSALEEDVMRLIAERRHREGEGAPATAGHGKPLILSNRWSRLRVGLVGPETDHTATSASASSSSSGTDSDADGVEEGDGVEAPVPFSSGASGMIRFGSKPHRGGVDGGFGELAMSAGMGGAAAAASSTDNSDADSFTSSSASDADGGVYEEEHGQDAAAALAAELGFTNVEDLPADKRKMVVLDAAVEKKLRARQMAHQRREREREAKLRRQFNRHMAGYDDDALNAQEQALLQSASEPESSDPEDEDEGDEGDEGDEEDEEDEEEEDDGMDEPLSVRARNESGGGFGARARAQREQEPHPMPANHDADATVDAASCVFPESSPLAHRQRFGSIFFETHVARNVAYPCHHTLLCLRGPITIQGPCGLIGFGIGEASVGGFLLGKKQLVLWNKGEKAVLMPMKKLKTKSSEQMELPAMTRVRRGVLSQSARSAYVPAVDPHHAASELGLFSTALAEEASSPATEAANALGKSKKKASESNTRTVNGAGSLNAATEEEEEERDDHALNDVEAVFGEVDWDWTQTTIKAWRELFKDRLPTMLLVVQPFTTAAAASTVPHGGRNGAPAALDTPLFHNPMRKHYLHSAKAKRRMRKRRMLEQQQQQQGRGRRGNAAADPQDDGRQWLQRATEEEVLRLETRQASGGEAAPSPSGGGPYVEIPSFISRQSAQNIDLALVPDIIPTTARLLGSGPTGGSVVVVGSQDVGKSTLCRFLANTLLSQHGLSFWLDLDLGQPEFGVPGQFGLYCIRRPLLKAHDVGGAELVKSVFVGSATASSPQAVANALATICDFVTTHVSRRHPVVVNTHGWVLHTGRRVTVEAIQRLLPKAVIHLVKEREEAWASDTASLMDPAAGLNADVVGRRFLVRDLSASSAAGAATAPITAKKGAMKAPTEPSWPLLARLPLSRTSRSDTKDGARSKWDGIVYAVRVHREGDELRLRAERRKHKGSAGRQQLWQTYLGPLIASYEDAAAVAAMREDASMGATATTAVLRAPLHQLAAIVLADEDERVNRDGHQGAPREAPSMEEVAATLEHRVVAVQVRYGAPPPPSMPSSPAGTRAPRVLGLDGLTAGFEVTCFGYVESTEREMLASQGGGGGIAIRLPLRPQDAAALLTLTSASDEHEGKGPQISIAVSPNMLQDTHFMESYP